jgi:hypothetical protein
VEHLAHAIAPAEEYEEMGQLAHEIEPDAGA